MKNRINSKKTTQINIKNNQKNRLLIQNKSPIALLVATAFFAFSSAHVIAAPEEKFTYTDKIIGTDEKDETVDISDTDKVTDIKIYNGFLRMSGSSEAFSTQVLKKGVLYSSGYNPRAFDTQIENGGSFDLSVGASATDTIVKSGGTLSIGRGEPASVVLRDTTIGGILRLRDSLQLEGVTYFLPTSQLEIDNLEDEISFINNGNIYLSKNNMEIGIGINGSGGLTIEKPQSNGPETANETIKIILIGLGRDDIDDADYDYSGDTLLSVDSILQIKNANFHNSQIKGQEKTELWIGDADSGKKSYLQTTVQGTHVSIFGGSQWELTGDSTIDRLTLSSSGRINLNRDNNLGNILTIDGDYDAGSQSLLIFNTQLGNDDSPTDRMIVKGNTAGETHVQVNNVGGSGDETNLGILLIKVLGRSDGEFKQSGRIVAGAYEYKLGRGKGDLDKNWYIRSNPEDYAAGNTKPTDAEEKNKPLTQRPSGKEGAKIVDDYNAPSETQKPTLTQSETQDSADPVEAVVPSSAPITPPTQTAPTAPPVQTAPAATLLPSQPQIYAPENGNYIANIVMARSLFNTRLDDRSGSYQYKDAVSGQWRTSSMWIHTQGGRNNFGHAVDQLNIKGKYYSVQLGMDVIQEGSGRIGVLAGLGKATNHSQSKITGYYSNGSVSGYNLGVYATWLPEQKDNTGFYFDTLAQYSWFNNTVNGQERTEDKYKSSGFTTSIESGYTFKMATTDQLSYFIQPNAQITLQGIQAQTHKTAYDELISDGNKGHMVTRIGAKTYLQTMSSQDSQFTPFISVNWLRQNQNTGTIISGQRIESRSKNSTEFKIGLESQIEQQLHIWATIDYQVGRYNDKNTNALAGIKYHF